MRNGVPLLIRLLIWLVLNLVLVLLTCLALVPAHLGLGWNLVLSHAVRERLQTIGEAVAAEVQPALTSGWRVDLARYESLYHMHFSIHDGSGAQLAGDDQLRLPPEVLNEVRRTPVLLLPDSSTKLAVPPFHLPASAPFHLELAAWPMPDRDLLKQHVFVLSTQSQPSHWVGVRTFIPARDGGITPLTVLASSDSPFETLRFINPREWVDACLCIIVVSVLIWLLPLWLMSRAVKRITGAASQIAEGHFEARVKLYRHDELGLLGQTVNTVAERLDSFLHSQKHFIANIAHELASPIGRLQIALDILRRHLTPDGREAFQDVHEEVQLLSELSSEMLAFSRVGIGERRLQLQSLSVHALTLSVLDRESASNSVTLSIPKDIQVRANAVVLGRALGNLVRNAKRYAGTAQGPIEIIAAAVDKKVSIRVLDRGPGVPELALLKLGDAFYRPEVARRRETGGLGLGLATVRNCVAACGGTVTFRNRAGGGFEAEMILPRVML